MGGGAGGRSGRDTREGVTSMRASELSWDAKQELLGKIRESVGYTKYRELTDGLGEDGLIDQVLMTAAKESAPAASPKETLGDRIKVWLIVVGFFAVMIAGAVGMHYGAGGALGVFSGIIAGGLFGAWTGNVSRGATSAILAGIGGAIGGGIAGWKVGPSSDDSYMAFVLGGAFLGWLIEKLFDVVSRSMPRYR